MIMEVGDSVREDSVLMSGDRHAGEFSLPILQKYQSDQDML